ncbi:MAG: PAS domain S-box protein [Burkholderiales bacterium]|nr:PAS domain S-box protein [Burkholderiales bacterium]
MPVLEIVLALVLAFAGVLVIYALGLRTRLASARARAAAAADRSTEPAFMDRDALDSAHALLDAIYASAPVGLGFWDRQLRFVRVNARLAEMNGLPSEAHIGSTPMELLPGIAQLEQLMAQWRRILSGELPELFMEISGETPAAPGEIRYWRERFFPVRVSGQIVGVGGVVEEVTERKLAEDALRRAHERLALAQRASGSGVWDWEAGQEEVYVSREYRNIFGLPAHARLLYREWLDRIHPDDRERVREARDVLFRNGGEWSVEFRIVHPLHGERWVSSHGELIRDARGEPARFSGISIDITQRKRAETGLRESEERFRWIVQRAPIPVFVHALDGEILEMSKVVTELTGWIRGDLRHARDWYSKGRGVPREQVEATMAEMHRRFAANEQVEPEVVVWTRTGEQRKWLFHRSEVKKLADGRPFLTSMAIDITEREKAQAALREADRRKDEFLAMLAHELRNPLAPIRNAVELLKSPGTQVDPASLTEILERQLFHLVRLVDDLLDVSRVTRGKIELRRQPVDLREVVAHAVEVVQFQFDERRQKLELVAPPHAAMVFADSTRLVQVVLNLLANASKFSPEGSRIALAIEPDAGSGWCVRVSDQGQGIAADLLPRIFDLFIQGEHSLDRTDGGLGIGLSLVKSLVEMHGGSVDVRSGGSGAGSEFVVRLPASVPAAGAATPSDPPSPSPAVPSRRRVLAVDDNRDSAESLRMLLELWGHEARCAFDGREALDMAEHFAPDVVLLDIGLPGMSGYDLAARIRAREALRQVTLIAVTGYGQEEDRRRVRAAGFDHHLVKPVDPDALERLMNSLERPAV